MAGWVEHYRRLYEESFDRLDDDLKELQKRRRNMAEKRSADAAPVDKEGIPEQK